jgi:hypothetical protein
MDGQWSVDPDNERAEASRAPDVIENGPRREPSPRSRYLVMLGVLLVLISSAGGYVVGRRQPPSAVTPAPSSVSSALPGANNVVVSTGHRCAVQVGDRLQLGIEVVNQSAAAVVIRQVLANLPLDGLRLTAAVWGSCGELTPVPVGSGHRLPAGATTWLTMTFEVLVLCPAPLPVLFELSYSQDGHDGVSYPHGFSDLGDAPYSTCSAS